MIDFDANLDRLLTENGWTLPSAAKPKGLYRPVLVSEKRLLTSGHLPFRADAAMITGKLGKELDPIAGREAAEWAALGILASIREELGTLNQIEQLTKTVGYINSTDSFPEQAVVLNGASEIFATVFGLDRGVGVRSAIGVNSLPLFAAIEIETIWTIV
jgi:enamine deaminase RidA (YjgF/YER057c/UK114 family)